MHAQLLSIALALTGALAAPTTASSPSSGGIFPPFSTAGATKVPGQNTLKYCADPSSYLMTFKEASLEPMVPEP